LPAEGPWVRYSAARDGIRVAVGHDDLDRILDPLAGIFQCGWQIGERKRVGMDPGRVKALFRHQRHRPARGAAAFAADAVSVDVDFYEVCDVQCRGIVRECGETNLSAAIRHVDGLIECGFGARTFDDVIRADPASPCRKLNLTSS
jgi:hypothetical protein